MAKKKPENQRTKKIEVAGNVEGATFIIGDKNSEKAHLDQSILRWRLVFGGSAVFAEKRKKEIAKDYYQCALKIFKEFLPEGHPNIKIVEDNLKALEEEQLRQKK